MMRVVEPWARAGIWEVPPEPLGDKRRILVNRCWIRWCHHFEAVMDVIEKLKLFVTAG